MNNNDNRVWVGIGININQGDKEYKDFLAINTYLRNNFKSTYNFDPVINQPHINLYDVDVPERNIKEIEISVKEISKQFKKFTLDLGKIDSFPHGSIYIQCEMSEILMDLEKNVVNCVNNFRENYKTDDYWQPWRRYSDKQKVNREKYGNPNVLNTFTPHITVGFIRTSKENLKELVKSTQDVFGLDKIICKSLDLVVHDSKGRHLYSKRFSLT